MKSSAPHPVVAEFQGRWPEKKPPKPFPTAETIIEAILASETVRLEPYRKMIRGVFAAMDASNTREKKEIEGQKGEEQKRAFLTCLRSTLPDDLVSWMDTAVALGTDDFAFNTLLGSGGGSDGNSHFSDNFMQSIWICFHDFDCQRRSEVRASDSTFSSESAIRMALFAEQTSQAVIRGRSPGLFSSQDVGGPNSTAGFDSEASFNPWNYILLLEGCLAFSGALAKRTGAGTSGEASFPFLMRLCNAGTGTLIANETSGRELWLPLWKQALSYAELSEFFAEGRLSLGEEYARTGLDAARAVASFGYDRGITSFQRIGIVRGRVGGDNYNTAIALGVWSPRPNEQVDLISEIDTWLNSFRRAVSSKNAPSRAQRALRQLEAAILDLCQKKDPARLQAVLIALGEAEATLFVSAKWRTECFQRPVPLLSPKWLTECNDHTAEFRLAVSLAAMYSPRVGGFRQYFESVEIRGRLGDGQQRWAEWSNESPDAANVVWTAGDVERNLITVLQRRIVQAMHQSERSSDDDAAMVFPGHSPRPVAIGDIVAFLRFDAEGDRINFDRRIAALLRGLVLLDWDQVPQNQSPKSSQPQLEDLDPQPDATFGLLKLCHTPYAVRDRFVRLEPSISRLSAADRPNDALVRAVRRLIGSNLPPIVRTVSRDVSTIRRMTAALLFPLGRAGLKTLADTLLKPESVTPPS